MQVVQDCLHNTIVTFGNIDRPLTASPANRKRMGKREEFRALALNFEQ